MTTKNMSVLVVVSGILVGDVWIVWVYHGETFFKQEG